MFIVCEKFDGFQGTLLVVEVIAIGNTQTFSMHKPQFNYFDNGKSLWGCVCPFMGQQQLKVQHLLDFFFMFWLFKKVNCCFVKTTLFFYCKLS